MKLRVFLYLSMLNFLFCGIALPLMAATPEKIKVDLFEAHQPVKQVFVYGPARLKLPMQKILPPGKFLLTAKADQLELVKQGASHPIVVAPRIVFDGLGAGV